MKKTFILVLLIFILTINLSYSGTFKLLVMEDDKDAGERYRLLIDYLKSKEINVSFVTAPNYETAAKMFSDGQADAMFSGSGVAGIMIIKEIAYPLLRPVSKEGISTYKAVVLGLKGSPKFDGTSKFFEGKSVIFTSLASAGEIFYNSLPNSKTVKSKILIASNHGSAIHTLSRGITNYAIVKNLVWEKNKDKYPNIEKIGEDTGENPDMTLIVSKKSPKETIDRLSNILLNIKTDSGQLANELKKHMGIEGFIKTTDKDFTHTFLLLKKAGITKDFKLKSEQ